MGISRRRPNRQRPRSGVCAINSSTSIIACVCLLCSSLVSDFAKAEDFQIFESCDETGIQYEGRAFKLGTSGCRVDEIFVQDTSLVMTIAKFDVVQGKPVPFAWIGNDLANRRIVGVLVWDYMANTTKYYKLKNPMADNEYRLICREHGFLLFDESCTLVVPEHSENLDVSPTVKPLSNSCSIDGQSVTGWLKYHVEDNDVLALPIAHQNNRMFAYSENEFCAGVIDEKTNPIEWKLKHSLGMLDADSEVILPVGASELHRFVILLRLGKKHTLLEISEQGIDELFEFHVEGSLWGMPLYISPNGKFAAISINEIGSSRETSLYNLENRHVSEKSKTREVVGVTNQGYLVERSGQSDFVVVQLVQGESREIAAISVFH